MRRQNPLSTLLLLAIDFSHHEDAPSLINDEPVCFMRGVLDFPAPSINQSVLILEIKKKKKEKESKTSLLLQQAVGRHNSTLYFVFLSCLPSGNICLSALFPPC